VATPEAKLEPPEPRAQGAATERSQKEPTRGRRRLGRAQQTRAARSAEVAALVEAFFDQERASVDVWLDELRRSGAELQERFAEVRDALAQAWADAARAGDDDAARAARGPD
jgi:hypothetical protein